MNFIPFKTVILIGSGFLHIYIPNYAKLASLKTHFHSRKFSMHGQKIFRKYHCLLQNFFRRKICVGQSHFTKFSFWKINSGIHTMDFEIASLDPYYIHTTTAYYIHTTTAYYIHTTTAYYIHTTTAYYIQNWISILISTKIYTISIVRILKNISSVTIVKVYMT
jgi:hypothetical protein